MIISGLILLCSFVLIRFNGPVELKPMRFMFCFLASGLAYGWSLKTSRTTLNGPSGNEEGSDDRDRHYGAWIWIVAILVRVIGLGGQVSDDVYRYLWEGLIQHQGYNPYTFSPSDEMLTALRPTWHGQINHPDMSAGYGPVAQWLFAWTAWLGGGTVGWQLWIVAADLGTGLLLFLTLNSNSSNSNNSSTSRTEPQAKLDPMAGASLYLWNPLVIFTLSHRSHVDAFLLLGLATIFYGLKTSRFHIVWIAASVCANIKFPWIILAPLVLIRLPRRHWLFFGGALLLPWLWYADAGVGLFRTAWQFSTNFHYNDGLPALARVLFGGTAPFVLMASLLAAVLFLAMRRLSKTTQDTATGYGWVLGIFVLLSPTVHPWYATWIVPALALMAPGRWRSVGIFMTLFFGMGYLIYAFIPLEGGWREMPLGIRIVEHGSMWLAVVWAVCLGWFERKEFSKIGITKVNVIRNENVRPFQGSSG